MKRISILNLILFACTMATAQHNYGIKAGISASYFNQYPQAQTAGFVGGVYAKQSIYKKSNPDLKAMKEKYPHYFGYSGSLPDSILIIFRKPDGELTYTTINFSKFKVSRKKTRFSIQEEINYVGKGGFNPDHDIYFKTHYLQGTVLAGVSIGCFTLQAGGYVARLVRTGNYTYFNHSWNWPYKRWIYNKMDYGAVAGLEINFHGAILSGQYQHGLRNVINKESAWHPMDGFKNRSICVALEVPFKL